MIVGCYHGRKHAKHDQNQHDHHQRHCKQPTGLSTWFLCLLVRANFYPGDHQGKALERQEDHRPKLWMIHKTRNELVTRHDPEGRPTVFDRLARLKLPDTLMPVVRN